MNPEAIKDIADGAIQVFVGRGDILVGAVLLTALVLGSIIMVLKIVGGWRASGEGKLDIGLVGLTEIKGKLDAGDERMSELATNQAQMIHRINHLDYRQMKHEKRVAHIEEQLKHQKLDGVIVDPRGVSDTKIVKGDIRADGGENA